MQISLLPEDAAMLREMIETRLVELRKEVAHTDSREFRHLLREREDMILRLLA